ncbi:MAG: hypothetical protein AAGF11_51265 [Myxococcota bacterium]
MRRWAVERAVGLTMGLVVGWGCNGAPDREPIPNPPPPANHEPAEAKATATPLDDDAAAEAYLGIKAKFEADPAVAQGSQFPAFKKTLDGITNGSGAKPMRANAALLLGAMVDARGEPTQAAGYYEHAATLIPDDAGPYMALAVSYAASKNFVEAVKAQEDAARLDPDNLENWLALGELRMRAGDEDGSVQAYLAYEKRRKGLIDGLTLHDEEGTYVVPPADRVGCAEALAAAPDQGTAVALVYALRREPEPTVRAAVARVMGIHRLETYLPVLQTQSKEEADPAAKEAVDWALAEIARDPVKMDPTERPRLGQDDPRATGGDVPRAEIAPVAPTEASTIATDDQAAAMGKATPAEPAAMPAGSAATPAGSATPQAAGRSKGPAEPAADAAAPSG